MRATLSSSIHEKVSESSLLTNSREVIKNRKSELRSELQQLVEKLSSLAKSLQHLPESQKTAVKKRMLIYQRRKRAVEHRLMELETFEFNTEQLTLDCEPETHKSITTCVVVGQEKEYKSEDLVPEINSLIEMLAGNTAPVFDEEQFKEEIDAFEGRIGPISLDGLITEISL